MRIKAVKRRLPNIFFQFFIYCDIQLLIVHSSQLAWSRNNNRGTITFYIYNKAGEIFLHHIDPTGDGDRIIRCSKFRNDGAIEKRLMLTVLSNRLRFGFPADSTNGKKIIGIKFPSHKMLYMREARKA